jgi:hypothetical protein
MGFTSGAISGEHGKPVLLGPDHKNTKKRSAKGKTSIEYFAPTSGVSDKLKMTSVDAEELRYLEMVGHEVSRFVRPRFNTIVVPEGAATIFRKLGEGRYNVAVSPTGETWWTYQQMESAIDAGQEIYVNINGEFIQIKKKAGKYTSALIQDRVPNPKFHGPSWTTGGTRRFLKKSKKTRKIRKFKKSL